MWPSSSSGSPAELPGGEAEVVDRHPDHDRAGGLAGAVARRDHVDAGRAGDRGELVLGPPLLELLQGAVAAAAAGREDDDERDGRHQGSCEDGDSAPHDAGNTTRNVCAFMRRALTTTLVSLLALALAAPAARSAGFADHVNPFAGTQPGPGPSAAATTSRAPPSPSGWCSGAPTPLRRTATPAATTTATPHLKGFSLTHLSGAGCSLYGDFPFLPTTEPIVSSPALPGSSALDGEFQPGFSHHGEQARPGYYSVRLNPVHGGGIDTELTATTRTGMARFTFPGNPHSSVLIDAGGSAQPDDFASVQVDPQGNEIDGTASSGLFCAQRPRYRVYFAAVFNRPFGDYGTWRRQALGPGSTSASDSQLPADNPSSTAQAGAYATFDTTQNRVVTARVGVSFVSVDDARANLAAENPGTAFGTIAARAEQRWNGALGRIRVSGGPDRYIDTFYTALYHALMAPRTFNDVNGAYIGMDGQVHNTNGRIQYADFSGWDIYRSEIQLLSILVPDRANEMIRSLLADAAQSGCLPRWSYANGQSMTMVGDSADPIIASAAAFGADGFDSGAALAAMVKGAGQPCESANGNTSSARVSPTTCRSATSPSTSTPTPATRTRSTATPTPSGARRRRRSSTRSTTSRSPSSRPAPCATPPPTAPSCSVPATGAGSTTPAAA